MNKVTEEMKLTMVELRNKGLTYEAIGKILMLSGSTIMYYLSDDYRIKGNKRTAKHNKLNKRERREYMKKYMMRRYREDEEFRERMKSHARKSWRKKNGKK